MTSDPSRGFAWDVAWFEACGQAGMAAWRGVESQSLVATMRLVDSRAEHEALEQMLDESKPPLPAGAADLHYLLFTPFRYTSPYPSRFRRPNEAGIWYGAESVQVVCAETAYWRHRFILDSIGLTRSDVGVTTRHTFFQAQVQGRALDLTAAPWDAGHVHWTDGTNYTATHAIAADARDHGIQWIRYESVRSPGAHCAAVLSPNALDSGAPYNLQEWACNATRSRVLINEVNGTAAYSWDF